MSRYTEAVDRTLDTLRHVAVGHCADCADCGTDTVTCEYCNGTGDGPDDEDECGRCEGVGRRDYAGPEDNEVCMIEAEDRAGGFGDIEFSTRACESCGSSLAGSRHYAHGFELGPTGAPDGEPVHLAICFDCAMLHANGVEPEVWYSHPGDPGSARD